MTGKVFFVVYKMLNGTFVAEVRNLKIRRIERVDVASTDELKFLKVFFSERIITHDADAEYGSSGT